MGCDYPQHRRAAVAPPPQTMNPLFQPQRAEWFHLWADRYRVRALALENPRHHENVERWRPLVERYWQAIVGPELLGYQAFWLDVEGALRMIWHESRGNPDAVNQTSGAAGLFQHLPDYFDYRIRMARRVCPDDELPDSPFDSASNVAAAAWLRSQRGWLPWAPFSSGKWKPYTLSMWWTGTGYTKG